MREWSNAYAYVSGSPCSSCPTFKLNYRPERFLMIRPEGERRLADDLQCLLSGQGIVILAVTITSHDLGWVIVVETKQSKSINDFDLVHTIALKLLELEIEDIRDSHLLHAETRSIISFHFQL